MNDTFKPGRSIARILPIKIQQSKQQK